ncbi:hypothetical protein GOBAR_AA31307 [Gossypium barbadense]|uniref:Protein transport protein Sec24-like At3g07100 n=1 Tax=Gossypium barbadense TaxID=3634 RepID=A0A2P5WE63_GOSBA|nr:hypothetical protein GOBAR_AA31307 [Gossypium barbadense]
MGTENPGRPNFPMRPSSTPFASAPLIMRPFSSSGLVVGSEASNFRPTPPVALPTMMPSSSASPSLPPRFSDPSVPSPSISSVPPSRGPHQRFPTPSFPSTSQTPPTHAPPVGQPPFQPPTSQVSTPPVSFRPQTQEEVPVINFALTGIIRCRRCRTYVNPYVTFTDAGRKWRCNICSLLNDAISNTIISFNISNSPYSCTTCWAATFSTSYKSSINTASFFSTTNTSTASANEISAATVKFPPSSGNVPQPSSDSSFLGPRPNFQQTFPCPDSSYTATNSNFQPPFGGYPSKQPAGSQASPFPSQQGSYMPPPPVSSSPFPSQQGSYGPSPPVATPLGYQLRDQMQHPGSAPPIGSAQSLAEDFSSLSLASTPGSIEPGLDYRTLPRLLDGDVEPSSFLQMYPMNCNPRYLRLTTSAIPNSQSLASRWHLPLDAVVCPLAEAPEGPGEYFANLDATGKRIDLDQRPELIKGSVEFVPPMEYMVQPPMTPPYFFLIDVSISAVRSGMIEVVAQTIRSCLDELPGFPRTQIGFITFDSTIRFYNMKASDSSLTQPQMMVVSDLDDIFVPLPDDLLVNLSESRNVVEKFLDSLPSMFQDNVNVESAFGSALKAAFMVMLRGHDLHVYGTDKEHTLRLPEDTFYKQMAADLTKFQIGVNIYAFSDKYTDIASLGTLEKYTGGQVYYYPSFQSSIHGEKLRHELAKDLTRETAWEAVMRIRCGKGIRFTSYHGNFMLRSTDLLALPALDCDKAYAMQYTASCGERRIRVHTAAAPVVADLGAMYCVADMSAIVSLLCRLGNLLFVLLDLSFRGSLLFLINRGFAAIEKTLTNKLEDARNYLQLRIVKALREYRNLYAVQHQLGARMIYPESLKFLCLYGLALSKSVPLKGGYADAQLDERCAAGFTMMALPDKKLLKLLYPSLIRIDEFLLKPFAQTNDFKNIVKRLPLVAESLDSRGLYIYDDGFRFVIWFGRMLSPDIARNLIGPDFAAELSRVMLSRHDNEMSRRLMGILKKLKESDHSYYQLSYLVRQGEQPKEGLLLLVNLHEDQMGRTGGYIDWIMQIHRQVQQNA